jgi:hypothetical protein
MNKPYFKGFIRCLFHALHRPAQKLNGDYLLRLSAEI